MPQPLLETGQHIDVRACLDIDRAACRQTDLFQGRGKYILAGNDPQHLATRAGRNPGAELSGRRTVQGIVAASCHLMQRTQRQTTTGQTRIDLAHAKWQHFAASVAMPFETTDRSPQRLDAGFFVGFSGHFTVWRPLCKCIS